MMRRILVSSALGLSLSCGPGPLPAENPKTEIGTRAADIPILTEASSEREASAPAGAAASRSATETTVVFADLGLVSPSAVAYAPNSDTYLVLSGGSTNESAFISQLNPTGEVRALKFIQSGEGDARLNAPTALAIQAETLYVGDQGRISSYRLTDGKPAGTLALPDERRVLGLAVAQDTLYVTSSPKKDAQNSGAPGRLHKLENGALVTVAEGPHLHASASLAAVNDALAIVDRKTHTLSAYALPNAALPPLWSRPLPGQFFNSVVMLSGQRVAVNSPGAGLFVGTYNTEEALTRIAGFGSPTQLGYDKHRGRILVALSEKNEVRAIPSPAAHPAKKNKP